jgi:hypothetical protein
VQVAANGPHHHLPRVDPHANLHRNALRTPRLLAIAPNCLLHRERGIAGLYRMILVGERRPEQGHDAVAHHLVDGPLVAMHRGHHALEDRVQQLPGLFGVAVGQQLHGAFQVGK